MRLTRTVNLHDGETAMSFASRLAAANGISNVADFAADMGLCRRGLRTGKAEHLERLAHMSGVDACVLAHSTVHQTKQTTRIGDHEFDRHLTVRRGLRVCLHCLVDDLDNGSGPKWSRPWIRSSWMLTQLRTCTKHEVLLTSLFRDEETNLRDDVSLIVKSELARLLTLRVETEAVGPSAIEVWARRRLRQEWPCNSFVDKLSLSGAIKLSEIIGGGILFGKRYGHRQRSPRDWFDAASCGYEIVRLGQDAILQHLESYHGHFDKAKQVVGGRNLYGEIYIWLQAAKEEFNELRDAMREQIINRFPVGPGDEFFGPILRRRWHSVQTASKVAGINPQRMRKLALTTGLVGSETEHLSDHRVIFDAAQADEIIDRVNQSVLAREAERLSGTGRTQWQALVQAGHVEPIMQSDSLHPRYRKGDIESFVRSIAYEKGHGIDHKLVSIEKCRLMARCSMVQIVDLLVARNLDRVGVDTSKHGLASVLVDPFEIKRKVVRKPKPGLSTQEVANILGTHPAMVSHLRNLGYFDDAVPRTEKDRTWVHSISKSSAYEFDKRYVTVKTAAAMLGKKSSARLLERMAVNGVSPSIDKAAVGCHFFLRSDIEKLKRSLL